MPLQAGSTCVALAVSVGLAMQAAAEPPAHWPQFRGPNASGVAPDGMTLPTRFGPGTSPVVAGERVFLHVEHLPKPCLLAVDRRTGATVWKKDQLPMMDGYATPVVWSHDGTEDIVTLAPTRIVGHDPADGNE